VGVVEGVTQNHLHEPDEVDEFQATLSDASQDKNNEVEEPYQVE
jgi:hypothetical protein